MSAIRTTGRDVSKMMSRDLDQVTYAAVAENTSILLAFVKTLSTIAKPAANATVTPNLTN